MLSAGKKKGSASHTVVVRVSTLHSTRPSLLTRTGTSLGGAKAEQCLTCNEAFDTVQALQTHREASNLLPSTSREQKRSAPGAGTGPSPKRCNNQPAPGEFPYLEDPVSDDLLSQDGDAATKLLYKQKWSSIRIQFSRGHIIQDTYNFRLGSEDTNDLADNVWAIFRDQQTVFKITGFSWVTEKRGRCEPVQVKSKNGVRLFLDRLNDADLMERARQQPSNSETILHKIPTVTFYIYKIKDHPIGAPGTVSDCIVKSKSINALLGDKHGPFTDKLCFLRCLALHRNFIQVSDRHPQNLHQSQ
ncbi:hypothetical protein Bbelb_019080 [Branchiostoma belcheri]|nr:hypothetical protein Bbelb_019080 [Branchiostoma belcheri]